MRFDVILENVYKKKQQLTPEILAGIKTMENAYDEAIDRLSKDKEYITSQMEYFGYNEHEVEFIQLLKDGLASEITGTLNSKIISNIGVSK